MKKLLALVFCLSIGSAVAQTYPEKPIRLLVGFAAGGAADLAARAIADGVGASLGKPVIIENKPGAGSVVAAREAARAEPDGYTLMFGSIALSVQLAIDPSTPLDPLNDFATVGLVSEAPNVLVVNPELQVRSVKELIDYAKAKPVSFASSGVGTTLHLSGEMLKDAAKVDIVHVPYKGSNPALNDLVAGRVQMMFDSMITSMPLIKAGKLRPLAVTTPKRTKLLPEVPTMAEAGYPDFETNVWFGVLAPKKTPRLIVERIADAISASLSDAKIAARFESLSMDVMRSESPERFAEFFKRDIEQWNARVAKSGVKVQK